MQLDKDEHVKEVYAYFGLSMYLAQVLEHGIVNTFIFLELIPKTKGKWDFNEFDSYLNGKFGKTLGQLISKLRSLTNINDDLEALLVNALEKRNWLAHHYFRERATQFMSTSGRNLMIQELQQYQELFREADEKLETIISPLREKFGITENIIGYHLEIMKKSAGADL
ncbi:MAG: hypothetical protein KKH29_03875 [Candidatus Omnitrophica bacterium]|nr:hypothetical protein [Candidatus Omnitrophota bacterium]